MLAGKLGFADKSKKYFDEYLKNKSYKIEKNEQTLLSIIFKNSIESDREIIRKIAALEETQKGNANITEYKAKVVKRLKEKIVEKPKEEGSNTNQAGEKKEEKKNDEISILQTLEKLLEPDKNNPFYLKLKGDYQRYNSEFSEGEPKTKIDEPLKTYLDAAKNDSFCIEICPKEQTQENKTENNAKQDDKTKDVPKPDEPPSSTSLGLIFSIVTCYCDYKKENEKGIEIAKKAIKKAKANKNKMANENPETLELEKKEVDSLIQLLEENLRKWETKSQ